MDSVGRDDHVRVEIGEAGDRGAGADASGGQGVEECLDEVGAVDGGERAAVVTAEGVGVPSGDAAAVPVVEAAGRLFLELVEVDAQRFERAQGVRPQGDARAHGGEFRRLFQDCDLPADAVQSDGGAEPADSSADHDRFAHVDLLYICRVLLHL